MPSNEFSSHVFTNPESTNSFHEIICFIFQRVAKCFFFCYVTVISAFLTSIENFYLVGKQSKEKLVDSRIVNTCDELDLGVLKTS